MRIPACLNKMSAKPLNRDRAFFSNAPAWNPRSDLITGKVCGIQVETIADPMMKKICQLDKLADELAKGKSMEKVIR